LHDWSEPFVATATRAPARSAETAAARPEAPLPITSTSNCRASATSASYQRRFNAWDYTSLFVKPAGITADNAFMAIRIFGLVGVLAALVIGAYLFAGGGNGSGNAAQATTAEQQALDAAASVNFQQAAAALEQNRAATGSYAGTSLGGFGVQLIRADAASYCIQSGAGPSLEHEQGPDGSPAPGGC
jgi:hypothetical protein